MTFFQPQKRTNSPQARVGIALFRLSQAIKKMSQMESDPHGLSPVQIQTLLFIHHTRHDVASMGALAQSIGTTHATAVGIVNGLIQKDLVQRKPKPEDRRVSLLSLTDKGKEVAANIESWGEALESAMNSIPDEILPSFELGMGAILASLQKAGYLYVAEPCLGCIHFRPSTGSEEYPHYCEAIQKYLTHEDSLKECPEHTPQDK